MGARGPASTPTAILKGRGSWRAKTRKREPKCVLAAPEPPEWLSGEALAEWHRQTAEMLTMGTACRADRAGLVAWCTTWADYVSTFTHPDIRTEKQNALCRRESVANLIKLGDRYGFFPSARARLNAVPQQETKDPMADLMSA